MIKLPRVLRLLPVIGALVLPASVASAETPRIYTNQQYVEDSMAKLDFDIKDVKSVLRMVLASLPSEVTVYPTENYFYFWFHHDGIKYAGNIRFDIEDRDKGLVHFNYFKDFTHWQRDEGDYSALLGEKDQVTVKKVNALAYDLSFEGRTVRFNLNDLSQVKPPEGAVAKGETYIGPVFDESGMRFFLVFNEELKTFLYIMDETVPPADQFNIATVSDRISIGIRTGFAYYDDRFAHRKILVGVNVLNTSVNNYLDGPFDQLPDNFIPGNELERSILAASPEMAGHMDRFGNSPDGETRYLIAPYLQYEEENELAIVAECANHEDLPTYYNCFNFEGVDEGDDSSGDAGDSGDGEEPADDQQQ